VIGRKRPDDAIDVIEEVLKRSDGEERRWMAVKIVVALSRAGFLDAADSTTRLRAKIAKAADHPEETADE